MAQLKTKGIVLNGTLKKDGVTFYTRNGQTIMRSSVSEQPHRRTRGQFVSRQRVAHNIALWKQLREAGRPIFEDSVNIYGRFCTLMRKLPVVFMTKKEHAYGGSLLLPGMPVSDGMLPDIEYRLGEAEGVPALLTSLRLALRAGGDSWSLTGRGAGLKHGEQLWLYRLRQTVEHGGNIGKPVVRITMEVLDPSEQEWNTSFEGVELRNVDGRLALTGELFGDKSMGWALVRVKEGHASSQTVATRCTMYEQYLGEEALLRSAESYGGLTGAEDDSSED